MMTDRKREAIENLKDDDADLCKELISEGVCPQEFAQVAWEHRIFRPIALYSNASEKVRDEIINKLDYDCEDETISINGMLMALAEIGDTVVADAFQRWEKHPKKWREHLYVGPLEYALEGSWCMENEKQRKLHFEQSYALIEDNNTKKSVLGGASKQKCPFCESSYQDLLVLDGNDPRISFLHLDGEIKIKTCLSCLPWSSPIISSYENNGEGEVIEQTDGGCGEPVDDETINCHKTIVLSKDCVPIHYCTEWQGSAIGGKPKFIDDACYAKCPKCGNYMKHLAQLSGETTGESGNVYVQICTDCKTAATWYQQT